MNTLTADQSEDPTFIHSRVDDLGLTMAEFRVYCHLKRRSNHGTAWPGIDSMARVCRMHKMTAVKAIKGLEERKMVVVTRVEGEGNRYRLTKPSRWIDQSISDNGTGIKEITDHPKLDNGHHPILDNGRVSTIEGYPLKESPSSPPNGSAENSSPKGDGKVMKRFQYPEPFETFWIAYPDTNASKFDTFQVWKRMQPPLDQCLEAIGVFKKSDNWKRGYVEYPGKWIKGRQWELEES